MYVCTLSRWFSLICDIIIYIWSPIYQFIMHLGVQIPLDIVPGFKRLMKQWNVQINSCTQIALCLMNKCMYLCDSNSPHLVVVESGSVGDVVDIVVAVVHFVGVGGGGVMHRLHDTTMVLLVAGPSEPQRHHAVAHLNLHHVAQPHLLLWWCLTAYKYESDSRSTNSSSSRRRSSSNSRSGQFVRIYLVIAFESFSNNFLSQLARLSTGLPIELQYCIQRGVVMDEYRHVCMHVCLTDIGEPFGL